MALLVPNSTCAELCQRSYDPGSAAWDAMWLVGCAFATALITDKALIYTFRGTVPTSICSWETDFDALPPYEDALVGPVHRGFGLAVASLWDDIWKHAEAHRSLPVVFTGHSMGAGEAGPCAGRFIRSGRDVAQLTTFGCPNAVHFSNTLLPGLLGSVPGDDWRNGPDQVPDEPRILFKHWRPMTQHGDPDFRLDWVSFHLIAAYRDMIDSLPAAA